MARTPDPAESSPPPQGLKEAAGWMVGWLIAPAVGAATRLRGARLFHAEGSVHRARVRSATRTKVLQPVARRLAGPALLRLSAGIWRGREWPDVLGMSIRFHPAADDPLIPSARTQDLLMITASHLLTLPAAVLTTDVHDYLANEYSALATFDVDGVGPCHLRARWRARRPGPGTRAERLSRAVARRAAVARLELQREGETAWRALVDIVLGAAVDVSQKKLRFSPFNDGAGLRPGGFVQALRVGPYRAGQAARSPARGRGR